MAQKTDVEVTFETMLCRESGSPIEKQTINRSAPA